jgi:two-component system chemotaxis sensor kinase CheA
MQLRKRLLPLVTLSSLLRLTDGMADAEAMTVVVATLGGKTVGLTVDEVFDTEEIVVKPVSPLLRHIAMFGGNTILGDGSVIMILDPSGMGRAIGTAGRQAA